VLAFIGAQFVGVLSAVAVATRLWSKGGKRGIVRHPWRGTVGLVGRAASVLRVVLRWSGQAFATGALM
jgi:hypothetical protein